MEKTQPKLLVHTRPNGDVYANCNAEIKALPRFIVLPSSRQKSSPNKKKGGQKVVDGWEGRDVVLGLKYFEQTKGFVDKGSTKAPSKSLPKS